jgi:hypothetical protein
MNVTRHQNVRSQRRGVFVQKMLQRAHKNAIVLVSCGKHLCVTHDCGCDKEGVTLTSEYRSSP